MNNRLLVLSVCLGALLGSACTDKELSQLLLPGGGSSPSIVASFPEQGAQGTGGLRELWVLFSEPMDAEKTQSAFRLAGDRQSISGQFRWEGTKLLYEAEAPVVGGSEHTLIVGRDAESESGINLPEDFVLRFRPGHASGAPRFVQSTPPDGASLAPDGNIQISFSKPVRFDTVADGVALTPAAPYTLLPNADRTIFELRPNFALTPGSYVLAISDNVLDDDGNRLASAVDLRWTVGTDFGAPSVASVRFGPLGLIEGQVSPGGERTSALEVTFSEPMRSSAADAVEIRPGAPFLPSWSPDGTVLTLSFDPVLEPQTRYSVTVGAGAADVAGNPLPQSHTYDFRTDGPNSQRPVVVAVTQEAVDLPGAVDGAVAIGALPGALVDFSPLDLTHQIDTYAGVGFSGALVLRITFSASVTETSCAAATTFEVILDNSPVLPNVAVHSVTVSGTQAIVTLSGNPFPATTGTPIYRLRIRGGNVGLRDTNGNELLEDYLLYVTF